MLGPSLRLVSQPLSSFETNGFLLLNGAFDETLDISGVIKLVNGYVNLFTTTFNVDQSEPNVAVFVPSMGLVPYVDVTLKSRVQIMLETSVIFLLMVWHHLVLEDLVL